jgi:hypothetical protein
MEDLDASDATRLDAAIRTSHVAVGIGATVERRVALVPPESERGPITSASNLYAAMMASYFEALLGAATDLDALDQGPAHCALPSVVAASVASSITGRPSAGLALAALSGIEAGSRLRAAIENRPGSGFHSVAVFGTVAAAAAAASALELNSGEYANALGIALTRAAGLSLNSAATEVGLTHFGWATAHGLEAAWLARLGAKASLDVEAALRSFYPNSGFAADFGSAPVVGLKRLFFKRFPCNIYLNLIVLGLADGSGSRADALRIEMPHIRHLDNPDPADARQARNSAQAVASIALDGEPSYSAFLAVPAARRPDATDRQLALEIVMDPGAATGLADAAIRIVASRNGDPLVDRVVTGTLLGPWDLTHAKRLVADLDLDPWVHRLYSGDYRAGQDLAFERVLSPTIVEVR